MYLTLKFLHIVAVISWMAGILYLYRLFINHRENEDKGEQMHEVFCGMEERLYRIITVPAMSVAVICGLGIFIKMPALIKLPWMHVKLLAIVFLIGSTVYAGKLMRRIAKKENNLPTSKQLRYMNEVPTILMLIIVGMVVFRPF